jgi:general secretion pathway protein F
MTVDLTQTRLRAQQLAAEWGVELGEPFALARFSLAAPAGDDVVLKVHWEEDTESLHEAEALELWNGDGAVRLLRRGDRALLEERALPGTDISELPEDEATRRIVADIRDAVRGGSPLSSALERQHGAFGRLYVNMVRAGEAGGSLHETLSRLAEYLERSRALRGRVVNALIYPAILLVMVSLSLLFLLGFVVPQFAAMYDSLDAPLPWFSRIVLGIGMFVRDWWIVLLAVPVLALLWIDRRLRDAAFRARFDAWLLERKFAGPLVAKLETARLARTLGTLLRNGVPLLSALGIGRNVLGNRALAADVDAAIEQVRNGLGLAAALGRGKRFPRLALQMVQVGEESGALDAMLLKAADAFERETSLALDRMLAALVPVVTLALAAIVGVVIMAVLTPIYDLTTVIG